MTPSGFYTSRLDHFTRRARSTQARLKRLSLLRLAIFLLTLTLTYIATHWGVYAVVLTLFAGAAAFLSTVLHYTHLQRLLKYFENLATINHNELEAIRGNSSLFPDGEEFNDPEHPFTSDLDIFGPQGVYPYFNRSASLLGKHRLAAWFRHPLEQAHEIRDRQEAVRELSQKSEWRQEFLATGYLLVENEPDRDDLLSWVRQPAEFHGRKFLFFVTFIPVLTFTVLGLVITGAIAPAWLLLYLAVPFGITGAYLGKINRVYRQLSRKSDLVRKYSGLLQRIEKEPFASGKMTALQKGLSGRYGLPSEATRQLSSILDAFENRNNMLMGFLLNFLFLWDIVQVRRTERWQARHKEELPAWLEVLAEADALCSLANFHFNHPQSIFPSITNEGPLLKATALGHPLIPPRSRVDNPIDIPGWKHFTVITGANMAGKSTYLRTAGVGHVLALAGSAVLAREMEIRPARLITSIRTRDSLQKNESYFYAELKRLKQIIDRLKEGERLVILLDEILKGTNSRDKQSGSKALLEKLLRYDASGLVATHDLALGEMEQALPAHISNKSFEVIIENDLLVFDYKLKEGIARQMNATFLMKKMGITD